MYAINIKLLDIGNAYLNITFKSAIASFTKQEFLTIFHIFSDYVDIYNASTSSP